MTIKSDLSWPLKLAYAVFLLGLAGAVALCAYDFGRRFAGFAPGMTTEQMATIREQFQKLSAERDQYSTTVNAADSQINIERAAQKQLSAQVKTLEAENTRLKEDLAFFESLLPADTGPGGVAIRRLKAEINGPNQIRYRLLVMQKGKGERDFVGNLQFVVTVVQNGKSAMMIFPESTSSDPNKYKLGFKHYQRVEGVLTLPEGALIKSVQARVLEKGQIRTQLSANL
jgi:outer membrane murein-binding lipoprotein Lpp